MADYENPTLRGQATRADVIDQGLRSYMLRIYNYMILGMIVTGLAAYSLFSLSFTLDPNLAVAKLQHSPYFLTQLGALIFGSPFIYVVMFAPFAFSLFLSFRIQSFSWRAALMLFMTFSLVMGLSMSAIFAQFVAMDIVRVFFITAIAFGGLSLFGYTTKMDLSPMRSFLIMGVWGVVGAVFVNALVLQSGTFDYVISIVGVLVFGGVTAFQTQQLKSLYYEVGGVGEAAERIAVAGAYVLYVSFINMFMFLLNLLGNRQD